MQGEYQAPKEARSLSSADLDGDGDPDLMLSWQDAGKILVFINDGEGNFGQHIDYFVGKSPENICTADFNGDTILDLVVTNIHSEYLSSMINDTVSTAIHMCEPITDQFILMQNFPNPFNAVTAIGYGLLAVSEVELSIYNVLGQEVATLFEGKQRPGHYTVNWDASGFPSGIYFYRLKTKGQASKYVIRNGKMLLIR
jgi:hypothetical protein